MNILTKALIAIFALSLSAKADLVGCYLYEGELPIYEANLADETMTLTFQLDLSFDIVLDNLSDNSDVPAADIDKIKAALSDLDQFDGESTIVIAPGSFSYNSGAQAVAVNELTAGFHTALNGAIKGAIEENGGTGKSCSEF